MKYIDNWFSNFKLCDIPIIDDMGVAYWTVENYYQAAKSLDIDVRLEISKLSASESKKYVRSSTFKKRSDWYNVNMLVMEKALRKKFAKGTFWYTKLIESKGDIIEWNNWNDKFWGVDINTKKGKNYLGLLLEKIRDEYLNEPS